MDRARPATRADLARLAELARLAFASVSSQRGGDVWAVREAPATLAAGGGTFELDRSDQLVVVAELDGYVVGYGVVRAEVLRDGRRLAVVDQLYTEPPFRELGMAELVMDELVAWAVERGCGGIDSTTMPGDRETKNFFERFGLKARALLVHRTLDGLPPDAPSSRGVAVPPASAGVRGGSIPPDESELPRASAGVPVAAFPPGESDLPRASVAASPPGERQSSVPPGESEAPRSSVAAFAPGERESSVVALPPGERDQSARPQAPGDGQGPGVGPAPGPSFGAEAAGPARPELAVGAVLLDDDRLLLIRRGRPPGAGLWSVPGGRVEPGETMAHAVVREVSEETGIECVCGELLGWVERFGAGRHFVIMDFVATPLSNGEPRAGDDAAEARWVPLDEVTEFPLVPGLAEFLHEHGILEVIA